MKRFPHVAGSDAPGLETIHTEPQLPIPSFFNDVDGRTVLFHHATAVAVGSIDVNGVDRITLEVSAPACRCGCGAPGRGLIYTPTPDVCRLVAAQLIASADEAEAAATAAAAALLQRIGARS